MPKFSKQISDAHQELWSAFRAGNHEAYTTLIQHYFKAMFTYAIRINSDRDFAKDCIQDVFYDLWRRRESIAQAESVKSYLFTALRFKIYREQKKWNIYEEIHEEYNFNSEINIETRLIEDQNTIELKKKIESVLNRMPPRQKEILYLRFYEDLDRTQIAEIMGISQQVVYNLLHKALVRLRKDWFVLVMLFSRQIIKQS